jgi:hypothetical protein
MEIVPVWPPVEQISVDLFMLHAIGGHSSTIFMQLAASRMQHLHGRCRMQHLHALAASTVQSRQSITLLEQLFEVKNEDTI